METVTKKLNYTAVSEGITKWLKEYADKSGTKGFILGVSGGIDSAVVSTLCAKTGLPLIILEMPIHQEEKEVARAKKHIAWLKSNYANVYSFEINLTEAYDVLFKSYEHQLEAVTEEDFNFSMANTRSRLRMTTLYQYAGTHKMLVAGTGNKVEDFGVYFYTKYGDGGVDISPIADLMKSEVYALGNGLGINSDILRAVPTDGLHDDARTDEEQIGASYDELEWAMYWISDHAVLEQGVGLWHDDSDDSTLTERQNEVLKIYKNRHSSGRHKSDPIPVFDTYKFRK